MDDRRQKGIIPFSCSFSFKVSRFFGKLAGTCLSSTSTRRPVLPSYLFLTSHPSPFSIHPISCAETSSSKRKSTWRILQKKKGLAFNGSQMMWNRPRGLARSIAQTRNSRFTAATAAGDQLILHTHSLFNTELCRLR